jgi:peptide deformylase
MVRKFFKTKQELDIYIAEQNNRKIKGYLTSSERDQLDRMIKNPKEYIKEEKDLSKGKPIVTLIADLNKPCLPVEKNENIKGIIQDLKDTLAKTGGLGISANQIGVQKKISYLKVPKSIDNQTKKIEYSEYVLINAKIINKNTAVRVNNEGCISFPGIEVVTRRYAFVVVEFENEKRQIQTGMFANLESLVAQHEIDHQNNLTIFSRKWRAK